jgi:DNA-directed RNA polymerase specialized sigma24 family protein
MTDDTELLLRYASGRSEDAFAELVRRHVDLVYSSALRQTRGDPHRAREVTQMVFIDLARKANSLVRHPILPAWLHRRNGASPKGSSSPEIRERRGN